MLSLLMLGAAMHAAAVPPLTGSSRIELAMASCGDDDPPSLRQIDRRNEWFEVIERYGHSVQVLRLRSHRLSDNCTEGPREATVEVQVSTYPHAGGKPQVGKLVRLEGEDPTIVDDYDWALLRVTRYGCCGAQDGYIWLDPIRSEVVALSSTAPLPLRLINHGTPQHAQDSLWRFAFGLSSLATVAEDMSELGADVIAELRLVALDRPTQRYAVHLESAEAETEEDGAWWIERMAWTGSGLDETGQTWWLDGPAPTSEQVDGMQLEVELHCQCSAPPLQLSIPVRVDRLDVQASVGHPSVRIREL